MKRAVAAAMGLAALAGCVTNEPEEVSGRAIYQDYCLACHGDAGKGNLELGAPNLTDKIWLYGATTAAIENRIAVGGGGVMPAWKDRLDPTTIKALTVYVHSLGGGK